MNLGLDELMIVNPGCSAAGRRGSSAKTAGSTESAIRHR